LQTASPADTAGAATGAGEEAPEETGVTVGSREDWAEAVRADGQGTAAAAGWEAEATVPVEAAAAAAATATADSQEEAPEVPSLLLADIHRSLYSPCRGHTWSLSIRLRRRRTGRRCAESGARNAPRPSPCKCLRRVSSCRESEVGAAAETATAAAATVAAAAAAGSATVAPREAEAASAAAEATAAVCWGAQAVAEEGVAPWGLQFLREVQVPSACARR
tara:strand:+ start:5950 stop:6609 length:660 start_codon:yes stop_codon:yes gene_type:complete